MSKFETKTFTLCDECVTVKTTVEDLIGSAINTGLTRYEAKMAVHDILDEFLDRREHKFIMGKIEEVV